MRRIFLDETNTLKAKDERHFTIFGSEYNHLINVLRMSEGDIVYCTGIDGMDYESIISKVNADSVDFTVQEISENQNEPEIEVYIMQGLPKGDKMEMVIQKGTELGASGFMPIAMEHSVVVLKDEKTRKAKQDRWQKIAEEAAKQSKRGMIPTVYMPMTIKEALSHLPSDAVKMVAFENDRSHTLKEMLETLGLKRGTKLFILIGPEGGISDSEMDFLSEQGFLSVSLGRRILRTETAGLFALSAIRFMYED